MIDPTESGYYVLRSHSSATSQKVTYRLMSRQFHDDEVGLREAETWARYVAKCESNKSHEVFVVHVTGKAFKGKTGEVLTTD